MRHLPYSSELTLTDYHLFLNLKKGTCTDKFSANNELESALAGSENVTHRNDLCINKDGDYVVKQKCVFIDLPCSTSYMYK